MSKTARITIVSILAAAICFIIILKQRGSEEPSSIIDTNVPGEALPQRTDLPRLVDLGAETCIPCKLMAPILKELKEEYAGRVEIEFLDIDKNPDLVGAYRVRIKPTQIFYDASGKELFRHEGFYSKEDILTKFKELGIVVK
ncbi:MAG: thioredoxin family protein [Sedimentisphaerales bacterium]|nr:thioredoxin family protein [Sedimentisphaerales bacterium]